MVSAATLVAGVLLAPAAATADDVAQPLRRPDKIAPELASSFKEEPTQDFWVKLNVRADNTAARQMDDWVARGSRVAATLRSFADESQAPVRAVLDAADVEYDTFWITNAIHVEAGVADLAGELSAIPVVESIFRNVEIVQDEPLPGTPEPRVDAVEWGIADINADDVWSQYGVDGENIVVANIDTGVRYDHPALINQYRGNLGRGEFDNNYNWFDVTGSSEFPQDGDIHGTHTMGTIVGAAGIGVAPGARWIASNALMGSTPQFLEAMEWMLEPLDLEGENPDASKRPHVISNSWGVSGQPTDPFGDDIQQAWIDSGIFGTWSNRNLGPDCDTTGSPGGRALSYSNGAYDINHTIASFSSRGPGQHGITKPNISGPGVNVRSSVPGGYDVLSGTSMSTPHLAGAVALLWSAAPALIGDIDATRAIFDQTAVDQADLTCGGTADDNNVFGEGRLDALAAVDSAPMGDTGRLEGRVTDAQTGEPVAGAAVEIVGEESSRSVTTEADGTYGLTLVTGTYDVTVSSFGFVDATGSVEIENSATTTFDAALERSESYILIGRVRDRTTGDFVYGVSISIGGTPLSTVTNDRGRYRFRDVPVGTYEITAAGEGCYRERTKEAVIDGIWPRGTPQFKGDERKRFRLLTKTDDAGYTCGFEFAEYVQAGTAVAISGDDAVVTISLPFEFPFYGQSYDEAQLSTNGHLRFVPRRDAAYANTEMPSPAVPNAVIAGFWEDLVVDDSSSVRTRSLAETFTIEYRNVLIYDTADRVDFEVTLYEDGQILVAYRGLNPAVELELGSSATVGIENASGTIGLQYSLNSAVLSDETAIRFVPPAGQLRRERRRRPR